MSDELRVLLVDDEEEFVRTLAERLEIRGVKALVALDGGEAINFLEEGDVDVVVLDVRMPGMSGLEVLRHIKETRPHLPVILLTGHGDTRDGIEGMRLGAFDYLMKPLNIDTLMEKLFEATRMKQ
ncbi:response regulator [Thermodesulforhabdus norvegica]|uniref:Response regulator receiver domain-containing protein n=1 Tax=Thermodesulforhabdus norvegica TaxID=39841 RepID=A0A1I4SH56_9BACT|nr:response regulator [Thermodesulforhabdus norvegica]SFM63633.1 Response regulator receiver domain-containing protein [Thermodesulforhabdus norvegica]